MCGICGFINHSDKELLRAMNDAIIHRGPDEDGYYVDEAKVSLAARRLSVIDLATGTQPIYNETKTVAVVFNGEIYNYKELRAQLESKGHMFYTSSDTEVIVHLYEEYGADTPKHLRGMFAFALWDTQRERLLLARDHLGIKPLFCAFIENELYFASELKPLLINPRISKDIDYEALNFYFTQMYIPAPLTIYKNIKKLLPGHILVFEHNYLHIDAYWEVPKYSSSANISSERYYIEELEQLLRDSIHEQLVSDVPLGVFLSGGLDSSAITAYASEYSGAKLKTFNVSYSKNDFTYNETIKARGIASLFDCDHNETIAWPDVSEILQKIVPFFGEPFGDSSCIANFIVAREARKRVTVALTGLGGDELFCGYPRYIGAALSEYYTKVPLGIRNLLANAAQFLPESKKARNLAGWAKRFTQGGKLTFTERYASWVTYLSEKDKISLYSADFTSKLSGQLALDPIIANFPNDINSITSYELNNYLSGDLLCMADRMSMANSLELRVPFLDTRLVEFAQAIPLALKIKGFTLKYLLKKILKNKLPRNIVNQKKVGFQVPIAGWLTGELKPMIAELLSSGRIKSSGIINYTSLNKLLASHSAGKNNNSDQIFSILMYELWNNFNSGIISHAPKAPQLLTRKKKKLLILNLGGIGDIVMMTPLLRSLIKAPEEYSISLLTIERSKEIAKMLDGLADIFSADISGLEYNPLKLIKLIKTLIKLRKFNFDIMINFKATNSKLSSLKMRLVTNIINPKFSIGRDIEGTGSFYDFPSKELRTELKSETALAAELLRPLGIYDIDMRVIFPVAAEDRIFVKNMFKTLNIGSDILIGMIPGAFRPSRRWPLQHWKNLIKLIHDKYPPYKIFIAGTAEELEFANSMKVNPNVILTNAKLNFGQLSALLERMHIVIANDTGPMHLAAAVGTKVVGIFGPGDVHRYTPSVDQYKLRIVRNNFLDCIRPCYKHSCNDMVCLKEVTPFKVFDALSNLLV